MSVAVAPAATSLAVSAGEAGGEAPPRALETSFGAQEVRLLWSSLRECAALPARHLSHLLTRHVQGASGEAAAGVEGGHAAKGAPHGLAGALGTLFSPVYSLFTHAAGGVATQESSDDVALNGGGGSVGGVECSTEDDAPGAALVPGAHTPEAVQHQVVHMLAEDSSEEDLGVAQEGGAAAQDGEGDEDDFDPLLFISTLPPLELFVPVDREPVLPRKGRKGPLNTLVLDLDETLVHSTLEDATATDFSFPVHFNNQQHMVNVRRRPALEAFLARVAQLFEVVIFTASQRVYAERLLNIIDPESRHIRHRIFRDSCVFVDGNYLKDLTVLGRDLARTIIVDNSPQAFGFQLDNGIPIESWFDDPHDRELLQLLPFLETLSDVDDVRPHICARFGLRQKVEASAQRLGFKPHVLA